MILRAIHRPCYSFRKVGVLVTDLRPEAEAQSTLFSPSPAIAAKQREAMAVLDRVNRERGRGTVRFGSAATASPSWRMRQANLSPCFTTRWQELLTVSS